MKKILIVVLLGMLLLPIKTKAGEMDSYARYQVDLSAYAIRVKDGVELKPSSLAWFTIKHETAYCVEPGVLADNWAYYNSTNDNNFVGISDEVSSRLNLIGYYGYGYSDHNTKEYYMATQELIWRETGISDMYWVDDLTTYNVINIENEKNEILRLVEEHKKTPLFDIEDSYVIGDTITLEDKNNVLSEYEVKEGDVTIDGNNITLIVKENNDFILQRKDHGEGAKYFYKDGYQTIGSFLSLPSYEKGYSIKGIKPKVDEPVNEEPIEEKTQVLEELPNTGKNDIIPFILLVLLLCTYVKKRN